MKPQMNVGGMMGLMSWVKGDRPAATGPQDAVSEDTLRRTVTALAERVGRLGIESVEIDGRVDTVHAQATSRTEKMASMVEAVHSLSGANTRIGDAAESTHKNATEAATCMEETRATVKVALDAILELVDGVGQIESSCRKSSLAGTCLPGFQTVNDVAKQTNLLALNASIEAARAGKLVAALPWWQITSRTCQPRPRARCK
jgi:methyl-accepting chemotaxis protein